jgi:hypothetical protein
VSAEIVITNAAAVAVAGLTLRWLHVVVFIARATIALRLLLLLLRSAILLGTIFFVLLLLFLVLLLLSVRLTGAIGLFLVLSWNVACRLFFLGSILGRFFAFFFRRLLAVRFLFLAFFLLRLLFFSLRVLPGIGRCAHEQGKQGCANCKFHRFSPEVSAASAASLRRRSVVPMDARGGGDSAV